MEKMIETLKAGMKQGVVEFVFLKKDGTERTAHGTTNLERVPSELHPKGTGTGSNDFIQKFFDVDKQEWRSFQVKSLLKVNM